MEENIEQRVDLTLFSEKIQALKDRIATVIVGQEQTVDLVLTVVLANGHVLLEGVPGVAKTLLARLVARLIKADFSRIQFTPDLMPSDVFSNIRTCFVRHIPNKNKAILPTRSQQGVMTGHIRIIAIYQSLRNIEKNTVIMGATAKSAKLTNKPMSDLFTIILAKTI